MLICGSGKTKYMTTNESIFVRGYNKCKLSHSDKVVNYHANPQIIDMGR